MRIGRVGKILGSIMMLWSASVGSAEEMHPSITINGAAMQLQHQPFVENGSTLVPLREIVEKLDIDAEWNHEYRTIQVTTPKSILFLKADKTTAISYDLDARAFTKKELDGRCSSSIDAEIDGIDIDISKQKYQCKMTSYEWGYNKVNLQTSPTIIDGVTYVPLRFLSENAGLEVNFHASTSSIEIKGNMDQSYDETIQSLHEEFLKQREHHRQFESSTSDLSAQTLDDFKVFVQKRVDNAPSILTEIAMFGRPLLE